MGEQKPPLTADLEAQEATKPTSDVKVNEEKDDKYKSEPEGKTSFADYIVRITQVIFCSYCN